MVRGLIHVNGIELRLLYVYEDALYCGDFRAGRTTDIYPKNVHKVDFIRQYHNLKNLNSKLFSLQSREMEHWSSACREDYFVSRNRPHVLTYLTAFVFEQRTVLLRAIDNDYTTLQFVWWFIYDWYHPRWITLYRQDCSYGDPIWKALRDGSFQYNSQR